MRLPSSQFSPQGFIALKRSIESYFTRLEGRGTRDDFEMTRLVLTDERPKSPGDKPFIAWNATEKKLEVWDGNQWVQTSALS